jgi:hypothetical protein
VTTNNVFWFAYYTPECRRTGRPWTHQLREGQAMVELLPRLLDRHTYGGVLLNPDPNRVPPAGQVVVDTQKLKSSDLIVLLTRPPLDDAATEGRLKISRSHTWLEEKAVFPALRCFFTHVSRAQVMLQQSLARHIKEGPHRGNMEFHVNRSCALRGFLLPDQTLNPVPKVPRTTMAFACMMPEIWKPDRKKKLLNGPKLLTAFSMGGVATLAWARKLGRGTGDELQYLLEGQKPRFIMTQITEMGRPPDRPLCLDFMDEWTFEEKLRIELE